jgi:hypothetical protein
MLFGPHFGAPFHKTKTFHRSPAFLQTTTRTLQDMCNGTGYSPGETESETFRLADEDIAETQPRNGAAISIKLQPMTSRYHS